MGRRLDPEGLPEVWERLYRGARGLTGNRDDAEALVQNALTRILRRPRFVRRDGDLAYLTRVMRDTWINDCHVRAPRPRLVRFGDEERWAVDRTLDPAATIPDLIALYNGIAQLSPPLREVVVVVDILDLSYRDAARVLGVPVGTLMSRLHRARTAVGREIEPGKPTATTELA